MLSRFLYYILEWPRWPYYFIVFTGVVIGGIRYKMLNKSSRVFFLLLLLTLSNEFVAFYCAKVFRTNVVAYNAFTILQFSLISTAYYLETKSKIIFIAGAIFLSFILCTELFGISLLKVFNKNLLLLDYLFVIIFVMLFFTDYFKKIDDLPIHKFSISWIGFGLLLFCVVAIFSFGFDFVNSKNPNWKKFSFYCRWFSNYLFYLSFIPAFLSPQKSLNDPAAGK